MTLWFLRMYSGFTEQGKTMISIEQDFMMVNLSKEHRGLLKTCGEREIVVDIKVITGANESDNAWLMEQMLALYKAYHARVVGGAS